MRLNKIWLVLLLIANVCAYLISSNVGYFDSALFQLQINYPESGLTAGKDFVTFYPFGISILSSILKKISLGLISLKTLIWPIHFLIQYIFFKKLNSLFGNFITQSLIVSILVVETIVFAVVGTEPFSMLITLIALLEFYQVYLTKNSFKSLFGWLSILLLLRWDRFSYVLITAFIFLIIEGLKRKCKFNLTVIRKLIICSLSSIVFYFTSIFIYSSESFLEAFHYVFLDPITIAKYRSKDFVFDINVLNFNNLYAVFLIGYGYLAIKIFKSRFRSDLTFLFFFGLSFIPYTINRPDLSHFSPFFISSCLIFSIIAPKLKVLEEKGVQLFFFNLTALVLLTLYLFNILKVSSVHDCNISSVTHYKSIFVGNSNYEKFSINLPLLYLENIILIPATKYISDEPGLQNRCDIQQEMIEDFNRAPKPTIFYLNKTVIEDKNNPNKWESCGLLENYFNTKTEIIGDCTLSKYSLDIRRSN